MVGGMHGRGHVWYWGVHGGGGHVWQGRGACVAGGLCDRGHVWQILRDAVNERAVRILLECILVLKILLITKESQSDNLFN